VSVLINRGDGSFAGPFDYATWKGPLSIAIGDLNDDGKPDLVTAGDSTVSILLNGGQGSSFARRDYRVGGTPESVAIGDLSGDQEPDLAIAPFFNDRLAVLVNIGKGGFGRPTTYRTESTARDLAIGDLNGDRKEDLVSANTDEEPATLSVLLNATGLCGVPHVRGRPLPAARLACRRGATWLLGHSEARPRHLRNAPAGNRATEGRQGQPRRQPRAQTLARPSPTAVRCSPRARGYRPSLSGKPDLKVNSRIHLLR